jgi:isoquinoline 1-oxidoreductase beta subunit
MTRDPIDRRRFLQETAAGGLLLVVTASGCRRLEDATRAMRRNATGNGADGAAQDLFSPAVYVRIARDGSVTVIAHRSEMGQGTRTSLAMVLADELEADWDRVRVEQAPGDEKTYGDQDTDGSSSIRRFYQRMREAGATGRALLESAAAQLWGLPVGSVRAEHHRVVHEASGRTIGYGALVTTARTLPVPPTDRLRLKQPSEFRYIGRRIPMVDLFDMTTGRAKYGIDQHLPDALVAVIARPPVYGATVRAVDSSGVDHIPGVVRIVRVDHTPPPSGMSPLGGVAVVATNTWAAIRGRDALRVRWNDGPHATYDSRAYKEALHATAIRPGNLVRRQGETSSALPQAAQRLEADYYIPHLSHTPMEPPVALASVRDGRCEVWAPTQDPQGARNAVSKALGIPVESVRVNVTLLGGGFGRKSFHDFIVEAALLSRAVGRPVKVQWTREDDIQHDYYHPPAVEHLEAGLDRAGRIVAWLHRSVIPSLDSMTDPNARSQANWEVAMGLVDFPYQIPNLTIEAGEAPAHTRLGWYRSVLNIPHQFAMSSFLDELAHAVGKDPRAFILENLGPDRIIDMDAVGLAGKASDYGAFDRYPVDTGRFRGVLELATAQSEWGTSLPRGEGRGLAVVRASASYLASVVHVTVDADGTVHIPRIDIAIDAGTAIHPDRVRAQMEGGTIMGLGNALLGQITFAKGRVEQSNFADYQVLRMDAAPRDIRVHIVPSTAIPGGVGEPAVAPTIPAVCNAIFAATGRRIRSLPVARQAAHAVGHPQTAIGNTARVAQSPASSVISRPS